MLQSTRAKPYLSPDGKLVAILTKDKSTKEGLMFLFDLSTGKLARMISNPSFKGKISWSSDSQLIAATTDTGIIIYRSIDLSIFASDNDEFGSVTDIDFSDTGKLAAVSAKGQIRIYQISRTAMQLISKSFSKNVFYILSGKFSPNSKLFAIAGIANTENDDAIEIFSANTSPLTFVESRSIPKLMFKNPKQAAASIAWSVDGRYLYAGSQMTSGNLWRWDISNTKPYVSMLPDTQKSTYYNLTPLQNGQLAYSSGLGWGILDEAGNSLRSENISIINFDSSQKLLINKIGSNISVAGINFDLVKRELLLQGSTVATDLQPPFTESTAFKITDWTYPNTIKLNGISLRPDKKTPSLSLAIAPDSSMFVVGYYDGITAFDSSGKVILDIISEAASHINLSNDKQILVVSTGGNGIISWYRMSDGQKLLQLFIHADKKRWVLWSPSGYYDSSPGADSLIGWHVNNGKDKAADFFPASRFRERFNRPDVLARILSTHDEAKALQLANAESGRRTQTASIAQVLPPVVDLLSPTMDSRVQSTKVTLRYKVRTLSDAPVTGIRVRVNGQAVSADRALKRVDSGDTREIEVTIPEQDSEISLFAENKNGVSVPASVWVRWAGKKTEEVALFKPKLYVLAVGVSKYKNPDYNLGLAAKDAKDFAAVFQKQKGKLYSDVVVKLLTDVGANKDEVLDGLDWLKQQVTARDVGVMFLAGHGMNDNTGSYYFLPHNADPDKLLRTGVAQNDIKITLNSLAGKAMFFVDSCHSGNALGTSKTRALGNTTDALVNELSSAENGVVVFSSSTGKQLSQENAAWGNGAFTKAVVEGLSGKADYSKDRSGKITHKGLDLYVTERVKELTKGQQSPVSITPNGVTDFPIAVVRQ